MELTIDDLKRCKLGAVVGNDKVKYVKVAENVGVNHGHEWMGSGENCWPWLRIDSTHSGLSDDKLVAGLRVTLLFGEIEPSPVAVGDIVCLEDACRLPDGSVVEIRSSGGRLVVVAHVNGGTLCFPSGYPLKNIYDDERLCVAYISSTI